MPADSRRDSGDPGERIERQLQAIRDAVDAEVFARVEDLVRSLVALYGGALTRIAGVLAEAGEPGRAVAQRLTGDPLVAGLFGLHGVHPEALEDRVERALGRVRPALAAKGGGVVLLEADSAGGRLVLGLTGSAENGGSSLHSFEPAIRDAVRAELPELAEIRIDALAIDPLLTAPGSGA